MNTEHEYTQSFLPKFHNGSPVSKRDIAVRLDNEPEKLLGFICDNDFAQVHALVHHSDAPGTIGNGMTFTPNKNKCYGELKLLWTKKDYATLNDIISHFRLNMNTRNYTTDPELLKELELIQEIKMMPESALGHAGYGFTKRFTV